MRSRWVWCVLCLSAAAQAANIRRVELVGFNLVKVDLIRRDLPVQPGETYETDQAEAARGWLDDLGLFIEVKLETKTEGQVVDLVYTVREHPTVRLVRIEGNTQLSSAALRPELATKPREILDLRAVGRDCGLIGTAYHQRGFYVTVEPVCDPLPEDPNTPVTVTFQIRELKVRQVRCEPLVYLREEPLAAIYSLKPGDLLTRDTLIEQQRRLAASGLFEGVGEPRTVDCENPEEVDVVFAVDVTDHPLLKAESLPLVDIPKLVQHARFQAVELTLSGRDLRPFRSAEQSAAAVAAARAAGDPFALWEALSRAGEPAADTASAALRALETKPEAARTAADWYALGRLYEQKRQPVEAIAALGRAKTDPRRGLAAHAALISLHAARLRTAGDEALAGLQGAVASGCELAVALPAEADIELVSDAFEFYYNALGASLLNIGVKQKLRLDGPVGARLMSAVADLGRRERDDATLRHLGKLVTAVGFVAQNLRSDIATPEAWAEFGALLVSARSLLDRALLESGDPAAFFFAALCDLLRRDTPSARLTASRGLLLRANDERLVDIFVLTALEGPMSSLDRERSRDQLQLLVRDVATLIEQGKLSGWGGWLLACKLNLALRDALGPEAAAEAEAARLAAEAAAERAVATQDDLPAAWWLLALARLKGPEPGSAVEAYDRLAALQPGYRDAAYARALALLAGGRADDGLQAMADLAGEG